MSKNKKALFAALGVVLLVAALLCAWYFGFYRPQQAKADEKGDNEISITVMVAHSDGQTKEFHINTTATYLSEALLEEKLMEGHEDTYGLYVDAMDGETAAMSDNKAWVFSINGVDSVTGVDQTVLEDGAVYAFTITTW